LVEPFLDAMAVFSVVALFVCYAFWVSG